MHKQHDNRPAGVCFSANFLIKTLIRRSTRSGPGWTGGEMVIFLSRRLLAGAPDLALAGLGPELVIFLLRRLLAGAPDLALAGLGLEIVIVLLRRLLA